MKKILLGTLILISTAKIAYAVTTYSLTYTKNLKDCKPFIEKYKVQIPTQDENTPMLNLQSTETIKGWQEGKCVTTSVVHSNDLNKDIIETKCAFTKEQIDSIIKKVTSTQKGDKKAAQTLQEELNGYAQDGKTCQVKNLIPED